MRFAKPSVLRERNMGPERFDQMRTEAIAALTLPDCQPLRTWKGYPAGTHYVDCDGKFQLYARVRLDGASAFAA